MSGSSKKLGAFALFVAGIAVGAAGLSLAARMSRSTGTEAEAVEGTQKAVATSDIVTLTDEKRATAGIQVVEVAPSRVRSHMEVPGVVTLDPDRVVEVKPRVSGIVRQVDAHLGRKVKAGERLVLLESADVGSARLDVRMSRFATQVARGDVEWKEQLAENVAQLMVDLAKRPDEKDVEVKFANKPLGADRALLLSNYAKYEMAIHEEDKHQDLFAKQLIGEHLLRQARHDRESAQALFESAMEQTKFDVAHELRMAQEALQKAEVNLIDAVQRLRLLGVPDDDPSATLDLSSSTPITADWTKSISMEDVAAYPIQAPFDGTITHRSVVPSQRVENSAVLFTLADLDTVRIEAKIAEKDYASLGEIKSGDTVELVVPFAAVSSRTAKVIYVGTQVDVATRTVPVVAEAENADGRLRPGQFCRVRIDGAERDGVLALPASALAEIDGKSGVFLAEADGKSYRFRTIAIERQPSTPDEMVVVKEGIKQGDKVVSKGAFVLKSELILSSEPEEE
jgi:multidrug efflux pump subunit AcrA (membrane-fusion protein)